MTFKLLLGPDDVDHADNAAVQNRQLRPNVGFDNHAALLAFQQHVIDERNHPATRSTTLSVKCLVENILLNKMQFCRILLHGRGRRIE